VFFPQRGKTTPGPHSTPLEFHPRNHARAAAVGFLQELYMSFNHMVRRSSKMEELLRGEGGGKAPP